MISFQETRFLPNNALFIKDIVTDIEKYPEFLPWCKNATILKKHNSIMTAELFLEFNGFAESYVSRIITSVKHDAYYIEVVAISGPFKFLKNIWKITQTGNKTQVYFSIDFSVRSRILEMLISSVFSIATKKIIGAFQTRANKLSITNNTVILNQDKFLTR